MSTVPTTNYNLLKVDENTEIDDWAPFVNGNWDKISTQMKVNADAAATALTAANGKAAAVHTHVIADTTGLQAALDSKPPILHTHTTSQITGLDAALALKAPLASPALTLVPTAPTAAPGTNTTQLSTTAFVQAAIASVGGLTPTDVAAMIATESTVDTGGNLTVTNTHSGKLIRCTAAAIITFAADAAVPVGTVVNVGRYGAGEVTLAGAIMRSIGGMLRISDQYGGVAVKKIAAGEWWVWGDLKT